MAKHHGFLRSLLTIRSLAFLFLLLVSHVISAQDFIWTSDGTGFYVVEENELVRYDVKATSRTIIISANDLQVNNRRLDIRSFYFSADGTTVLIYTNSVKVWRLDTRGDYWTLNLQTKQLKQLGKELPPSSLMFAKFSPDSKRVAYVSGNNIYVEDVTTGAQTQLTHDGTRKLINGTFDWVYEEELACRDGFQWSPDGKNIAFWQVDATRIPDFNMINNTDSVYSSIIPVEYPTAGQDPSSVRIGIIPSSGGDVKWLPIPGDPKQNYLPRMEWNSPKSLFVEQINRKQNESRIYDCNTESGQIKLIRTETDNAWVDVITPWQDFYFIEFRHRFQWINNNQEFIWISEKDGWSHLYRITKAGHEVLITPGAFDVMSLEAIDEKNNLVYFTASPSNASQAYLFKMRLDGKGKPEQVTPADLKGTHEYDISPLGKYAWHTFSNTYTQPVGEFISLPDHKALNASQSIAASLPKATEKNKVEFFKVKTEEGVELDGWMVKPENFDPKKKYPIVFLVYAEPAGANVKDSYGTGRNHLYSGDMRADGYIYATIDNRGTPAPKGKTWRKAIYRNIGRLNIKDQALAVKEMLKWPFIDPERVAVWGWSGGGSTTLNLMFQYPEIYKTGIAVAAVANQLTYDNIYQERYMGIPQETMADYVAGSPITHAKNLKGNLLYIHGTGDDNVHYANAEMLINELVKYNKPFQFMAYPNRTHSIKEGMGTTKHLSTLYTTFLKMHCPPGAR
ncbi:DPP IV N-terminal domain-containing protein [Chryseolinea sp. T2]|uniref:S9 family peptidase n=1 Tax=Chryseolinea sp. T2 TaxID=3129255 RepID=UPI00307839F5